MSTKSDFNVQSSIRVISLSPVNATLMFLHLEPVSLTLQMPVKKKKRKIYKCMCMFQIDPLKYNHLDLII